MAEPRTGRPILHVIAGPNGAGKTTLYNTQLKPLLPGVPFVNADELARERFGHPAATEHEAKVGQQLADDMRRSLMEQRKSLITESTFSHPSKLDLIRDAKAAGYSVAVHHVNVRSPELSVYRVRDRVQEGGHDVPEDRIRGRYERNQPIIRDAARMADRAYVYDNSRLDSPHVCVLKMQQGRATFVGEQVPPWARKLYEQELQAYAPERVNRAAASFARAQELAARQIGPDARLFVARSRGEAKYAGEIVAETDMHLVQKVGQGGSAIAHLKSALANIPVVGERVMIAYQSGRASVTPASTESASLTPPAAAAASALAAGSPERPMPSTSYTGPIVAVDGNRVIQDVGGGKQVEHAKDKLYRNGGGLSAALNSGRPVAVVYSKQGLGRVLDAPDQSKNQGPKR